MSGLFKTTGSSHKFLYEMINDDWLSDINVLKPQYIKLLKTSVKHYISRMAALNIHTNPYGGG